MDDYIGYLLDDISPLFSKLVIVCNGFLLPESREKLEKYSQNIFVRENKGFDFCAWKEAMFDYLGYARVREYDELVLFNDSFFGPLHSFSHIFGYMENRQYDFWGLSVHGEVNTVKNMCPYGYRPRYIQTYFISFNKRMLNDEVFIQFWKGIPVYSNFQEVSEKCSAVLTKFFEDRGYRWGVYSDTSDLEESREKNICHHAFNCLELIENRNYPIIKRKSFVLGKMRFLQYNTGLDLPRAVKYIVDNNLYDIDLIFKHIIRRYDVADIKESLNLNYIIRADEEDDVKLLERTLVCAYIDDERSLNLFLKYTKDLSVSVKVFIRQDLLEKNKILADSSFTKYEIHEFQDSYIECLLKIVRDYSRAYDYLLFIKNLSNLVDDVSVSHESALEMQWDNILSSKENILHTVSILKKEKYLGMLTPPPPVHGRYYTYYVNSIDEWNSFIPQWNGVLSNAVKETKNNKIISAGGVLAVKMKALMNLLNVQHTESLVIMAGDEKCRHYFDCMLPYIVQKNGYLTGWCMNEEYIASEIESLRYISESIIRPKVPAFINVDMNYPIMKNELARYINNLRQIIIKQTKQENNLRQKIKKQAEQENNLRQKIKKQAEQKNKVKQEIVEKTVEVPVLVEIGLKRAFMNYIRKKIPFLRKE